MAKCKYPQEVCGNMTVLHGQTYCGSPSCSIHNDTSTRIEEIKARVEAYKQNAKNKLGKIDTDHINRMLNNDGYSDEWSNIAAHSSIDIPFLLSEIERLKKENQAAVDIIANMIKRQKEAVNAK